MLSLLAAAVVHYLFGGIRLQAKQDRLSGAAQVQISVLAGLFVLFKARGLLAGPLRPDQRQRRAVHRHRLHRRARGAAREDDPDVHRDHLRGAVLRQRASGRTWLLPSVGLALLVLSAILLGVIWPGIVQQFQVKPSEPDKEAPYIASEHQGDPDGLRHRRHRGHAVRRRT